MSWLASSQRNHSNFHFPKYFRNEEITYLIPPSRSYKILFANQPTLFSPSLVHLESGFDSSHTPPPPLHYHTDLINWFDDLLSPPSSLPLHIHSGRCPILDWKSSRYRVKYWVPPIPPPLIIPLWKMTCIEVRYNYRPQAPSIILLIWSTDWMISSFSPPSTPLHIPLW